MLREKPLSLEIISMLTVSIILHMGIVGTLVYWTNLSNRKESSSGKNMDFMWVSPVNIAEVKSYERKLPPPVVRPPAPKKNKVEKAKVVERTAKTEKKEEKRPKETRVDNTRNEIAKALTDISSELAKKTPRADNYNLDDLKNRRGGMGGTGVPDSMETYRYKMDVISILRGNWYIINRAVLKDIRDPLVKITIKIDSQGNILSKRLERESGNTYYDNSVIRAIEKSDPLPPPPEGLAREVLEEGLEIDFIPPSN